MSQCSLCTSIDVARWPTAGAGGGLWNHQCRGCQHTWTTVEVPEAYLRTLISNSLELAAIKANRKEQP